MKEPSVEIIELELSKLVRRITLESTAKKYGSLDRAAYLLLHHLSSHGPAGVKALAEAFRLDSSTTSRQTAALEQKGYVYRIPSEQDRRAYFLSITDSGAAELASSKQVRITRILELLNDWKPEEADQFGQLLAKFNRSLD